MSTFSLLTLCLPPSPSLLAPLRRVRCEFLAEGIRTEHVPPGGCVFNPIEPINFLVQQWIAAWDNKGTKKITEILGPMTEKEMNDAVAHCF